MRPRMPKLTRGGSCCDENSDARWRRRGGVYWSFDASSDTQRLFRSATRHHHCHWRSEGSGKVEAFEQTPSQTSAVNGHLLLARLPLMAAIRVHGQDGGSRHRGVSHTSGDREHCDRGRNKRDQDGFHDTHDKNQYRCSWGRSSHGRVTARLRLALSPFLARSRQSRTPSECQLLTQSGHLPGVVAPLLLSVHCFKLCRCRTKSGHQSLCLLGN